MLRSPKTAALASWRNHASYIAFGTLLALFCSAFLLKVMSTKVRLLIDSEATSAQTSRELQRANVTVDAALNNMSQGLVMFDSSARLIVCNQRYLELYGVSAEVVRPGCSFREILEQRVATGNIFVDDVDQHIAEVLAGVRSRS